MKARRKPHAFYFLQPKSKEPESRRLCGTSDQQSDRNRLDRRYIGLASEGLACRDMPSSNFVWGMYLRKFGFEERSIENICPACTTVKQFTKNHPKGRYVLATQNHVVAAIDGNYYDTWDSGDEIVIYFYKKET